LWRLTAQPMTLPDENEGASEYEVTPWMDPELE
jgi:hypothetical protein